MLYTPTTTPIRNFPNGFYAPAFPVLPKTVASKTIDTNSVMQHRCVLSYAVPRARVSALVPVEFSLPEICIVTMESFVAGERTPYEQTNFRVQAKLHDTPCHWLLGTALGSLAGVAARQLYPLPWHLGAMELTTAYDAAHRKYGHYRLRMQSEWANADWEIADTGLPFHAEMPLGWLDYFVRRDGKIGSYHTHHQPAFATQGAVQAGRCDLLQRLGILLADELSAPVSVALQHSVVAENYPLAFGLVGEPVFAYAR